MDAEWITYGDGFTGYFVQPMEPGIYPGVVMIHEWWGLNQNIKNMAHDMAEEGFLVLAVDLYNGQLADNPADAGRLAGAVRDDMNTAIAHLQSATQYLRSHEFSQGQVASMGWCFGGGLSMQLALNEQMDATVIYYGAVETDETALMAIDWPVLGIFGDQDAVIPIASVRAFDAALDNIGVENEIYVYEGLGHAFANPSNADHDPESTVDAWMKTVSFLNTHLKVAAPDPVLGKDADTYFKDQIVSIAVANRGQPIEGFDAFLLLDAYTGLEPSDFDGVAGLNGQYEFTDDLQFILDNDGGPITSADGMVEDYELLLDNIAERYAVVIGDKPSVDQLMKILQEE